MPLVSKNSRQGGTRTTRAYAKFKQAGGIQAVGGGLRRLRSGRHGGSFFGDVGNFFSRTLPRTMRDYVTPAISTGIGLIGKTGIPGLSQVANATKAGLDFATSKINPHLTGLGRRRIARRGGNNAVGGRPPKALSNWVSRVKAHSKATGATYKQSMMALKGH